MAMTSLSSPFQKAYQPRPILILNYLPPLFGIEPFVMAYSSSSRLRRLAATNSNDVENKKIPNAVKRQSSVYPVYGKTPLRFTGTFVATVAF
jgi:hypothetical protein